MFTLFSSKHLTGIIFSFLLQLPSPQSVLSLAIYFFLHRLHHSYFYITLSQKLLSSLLFCSLASILIFCFCFLLCLFPLSYGNLPLVSSSYLTQPERISLWETADSSQSPLTVVRNGVTGVQRLVSLRPWNLEASWGRGTNISCHTDFLKFNPFILLFFTCNLRLSPDFFFSNSSYIPFKTVPAQTAKPLSNLDWFEHLTSEHNTFFL